MYSQIQSVCDHWILMSDDCISLDAASNFPKFPMNAAPISIVIIVIVLTIPMEPRPQMQQVTSYTWTPCPSGYHPTSLTEFPTQRQFAIATGS